MDATPTAHSGRDQLVLDEFPSLTTLYARAARPGRDGRSEGDPALPATTVVHRGVTVDRDRVAAYVDVVGARLTDAVPPTYLHLLTFPLSIVLMTDDAFPFPLLGTVHLHQQVEVRRPVTAGTTVDVAVRLGGLRPHPKGALFDVHATVTDGGEVVWTGTSGYLRRGVELPTAADASTAQRTDAAAWAVDGGTLPLTARWDVPGDAGRSYGAVSGDRNPIHLSAVTARPFGFDRPIAHGMWTLARALAGLEGRVPDRTAVDASFGAPLSLPGTVTYASTQRDDGWAVAVRDDDRDRTHLTALVTPV